MQSVKRNLDKKNCIVPKSYRSHFSRTKCFKRHLALTITKIDLSAIFNNAIEKGTWGGFVKPPLPQAADTVLTNSGLQEDSFR